MLMLSWAALPSLVTLQPLVADYLSAYVYDQLHPVFAACFRAS